MHPNQDLQHILNTAEVGERAKLKLSAEGIYSVADLLSAECRISNGSIKISRGNRMELKYIFNWIRFFKENHARMPNYITEFTKDSFEEYQNIPGEELHSVSNQMLLDFYVGMPKP
jgi:hypothetical protein